jgi:hypothetical protein
MSPPDKFIAPTLVSPQIDRTGFVLLPVNYRQLAHIACQLTINNGRKRVPSLLEL